MPRRRPRGLARLTVLLRSPDLGPKNHRLRYNRSNFKSCDEFYFMSGMREKSRLVPHFCSLHCESRFQRTGEPTQRQCGLGVRVGPLRTQKFGSDRGSKYPSLQNVVIDAWAPRSRPAPACDTLLSFFRPDRDPEGRYVNPEYMLGAGQLGLVHGSILKRGY